jgi:hypothetical protein
MKLHLLFNGRSLCDTPGEVTTTTDPKKVTCIECLHRHQIGQDL